MNKQDIHFYRLGSMINIILIYHVTMTCARRKIGQDGRGSHSLVAFMALDKRYKIKVADWDIVGKYCVWPSKMD